ncbi:MAG: glycosyltransferase [Candidatus Electrothrix sp. AR3]|nr:glycosyltransferase [Candidatus Electrothrix sp. AR3]
MILIEQKILSISIIIPVLNEEESIGACLDHLPASSEVEILVVDGGSTDQTLGEVRIRGLKPIVSATGRGTQQHAGAQAASKDILLFLHCDTRLPPNFSTHIHQVLQRRGIVAGAFRLAINASGIGFRCIEAGVQLRSLLLDLPYGDQAFFMYRKMYFAVGGFPKQPIMEDIALLSQLKKQGKISIASAQVTTSARRWQQHGLVKTTIINQIMLLGRVGGIAPHRLSSWYYFKNKK